MAASIRTHEPVRPLRPVYGRKVTVLVAGLAELLRKGRCALAGSAYFTQQPQHISAPQLLSHIPQILNIVSLFLMT